MRAWLVLTAALVLGGGCFSQLTASSDITCDSLEHCPSGYLCDPVARVCRASTEVPTCARDLDCPLAQICVDGVCGRGCARDGDCGLGVACIDGACTADGRCNSSATCPFGQSCSAEGRCETPAGGEQVCQGCVEPRLCLTDAHCPGTPCVRPDPEQYGRCQQCGGGTCQYHDAQAPGCASDAQCGSGRICYRAGCHEDGFCAQNGWGACGAFAGRGGASPAPPDGLGSCTLGTCLRAECSFACDPTAEVDTCGRGYACTRFIAIPATNACTTDAQCAAGAQCWRVNESDPQQFCTCTGDGDCEDGARCREGVCLVSSECMPLLGLTCQELQP